MAPGWAPERSDAIWTKTPVELDSEQHIGRLGLGVGLASWRPDASGSLQDYVDESFAALRSEMLT